MQGIDFRGIRDVLDVTQLPEFTSEISLTRRKIEDAGLGVSGISSSIRVCVPEKLEENLEEARRTIAAARDLGCQQVRVFGGGDSENHSKEALADIGRETVEHILELDGAREVRWVFETHDEWIRAADCALLLTALTIRLSACCGIWGTRRASAVKRRQRPMPPSAREPFTRMSKMPSTI